MKQFVADDSCVTDVPRHCAIAWLCVCACCGSAPAPARDVVCRVECRYDAYGRRVRHEGEVADRHAEVGALRNPHALKKKEVWKDHTHGAKSVC